MSKFVFTPATKELAYLRAGLVGPSGGGKTMTALTIARALGGTTGVIDTERGSASKYSHLFAFKHLVMTQFDPADLTVALADGAEQGIDTMVIDSWSHFWEGTGGMLEQVDRKSAAAGRSDKFGSGWKEMRPVERRMVDAIVGYPGHVIVTLRTKTEYVVERNPTTGKSEPRRVGLKPVQRDGIEYEFDLVGDMDGGTLTVTKSRCPELTAAVLHHPTDDLGHQLDAWLHLDAVGEPGNPLTIRDWAIDDARTVDELRARFEELKTTGLAGAAVNAPNGVTWALGDFLRECAMEVRRREQAVQHAGLGGAVLEAVAA